MVFVKKSKVTGGVVVVYALFPEHQKKLRILIIYKSVLLVIITIRGNKNKHCHNKLMELSARGANLNNLFDSVS